MASTKFSGVYFRPEHFVNPKELTALVTLSLSKVPAKYTRLFFFLIVNTFFFTPNSPKGASFAEVLFWRPTTRAEP